MDNTNGQVIEQHGKTLYRNRERSTTTNSTTFFNKRVDCLPLHVLRTNWVLRFTLVLSLLPLAIYKVHYFRSKAKIIIISSFKCRSSVCCLAEIIMRFHVSKMENALKFLCKYKQSSQVAERTISLFEGRFINIEWICSVVVHVAIVYTCVFAFWLVFYIILNLKYLKERMLSKR